MVVPAAAGATQVSTSLEEVIDSTTDNHVSNQGSVSRPISIPPLTCLPRNLGSNREIMGDCGYVQLLEVAHTHQAHMHVLLSCLGDPVWSTQANTTTQASTSPPKPSGRV